MVTRMGRIVVVVAASACIGSVLIAGGDGKEKKEQVKPAKQSKFETLDTDGNGSISLSEFAVMHDVRMAKMKAKAGEGKAVKMQTAEEAFKKMDANMDGVLSSEEVSASKPKGDGEKKNKDAGKLKAERKPKAERKDKPAKDKEQVDEDQMGGGENADW